MRRILLIFVALILTPPTQAFAQDRPRYEIGTSAAFGVLDTGGDDNVTFVGFPGTSQVEGPSVYVSFFPSDQLVIEPEATLRYRSSGGDSSTRIGLNGRVKYLLRGVAAASPYVAGQAGLLRVSFDEGETGYSFGGGIGYRAPVSGSLAVSIEGRYRRWTGEDLFGDRNLNEFAFVVAVGGVVQR